MTGKIPKFPRCAFVLTFRKPKHVFYTVHHQRSMDIVANTRTNHWVVLKSKTIFLALAELNHFRIKRSLFLLTRKFINDLIKKNSCLFAKCGTQTKLFLVMAHKIRCYYGKRFSSLLFCTPIFKICLFVLIFEFPALFCFDFLTQLRYREPIKKPESKRELFTNLSLLAILSNRISSRKKT